MRLFGKNREQVHIDGVEHVDVVVDVLHRAGRLHVFRERCERRGYVDIGQGVELGRRKRRWSRFAHAIHSGRCIGCRVLRRPLGQQFDIEFRTAGGRQVVQQAVQSLDQFGLGILVETGSKLVQQPPDVLGRIDKQLRLGQRGLDPFALMQGDCAQRVLQRPGNPGQGFESHRGRTTRQGVRQPFGLLRQRLQVLQLPLAQQIHQATRPLIGLVEVHVVELDPDAQWPDLARLVVGHIFRSRCSGLHQGQSHVHDRRLRQLRQFRRLGVGGHGVLGGR